jgi:hypothetical protein
MAGLPNPQAFHPRSCVHFPPATMVLLLQNLLATVVEFFLRLL